MWYHITLLKIIVCLMQNRSMLVPTSHLCMTWSRVHCWCDVSHCESTVLDASWNHTHNECFEFLFNCRSETQAWDLQSLLIKPVQRVLKYPLLLDKLVASTSAKHPDHAAVHNARDAISQVAQDINEIKRRKDLGRQMYVHIQGHWQVCKSWRGGAGMRMRSVRKGSWRSLCINLCHAVVAVCKYAY